MLHLTRYAVIALILTGCASNANVDVLQRGPEVSSVYSRGTEAVEGRGTSDDNPLGIERVKSAFLSTSIYQPEIQAWTRDSRNEINGLFPKLPNPQITIYIYPHLASSEELPVPGYATQLNLYASDQFALPAELPSTFHETQYKRLVLGNESGGL